MRPRGGEGGLLVAMVCPLCGKELDAGPGDRLGLCIPCQAAHFIGHAGGGYPLRYLVPAFESAGQRRFLPFWKFSGSWDIRAQPAKKRLYARFPPRGDLFFPAFWRPALSYSADLTWRLFALPQRPSLRPGEDSVPGGVRSPEVIPEMARLSLLSYLDRIADVEGVELDVSESSLEYIGYPFWGDCGGWTDGLLGVRFPPTLFAG